MTRLGAILAGGRARRFGSDKALATWQGRPLIVHAAAALRPHCAALVVCGRPEAPDGLRCIPDRPRASLGPLGGLCAALHHAAVAGHDCVLSLGCDMPTIDTALLARLAAHPGGGYLAQAPVVGCWPTALAAPLYAHLRAGGDRSVRRWADAAAIECVDAGSAVANLNHPDDLAALGED